MAESKVIDSVKSLEKGAAKLGMASCDARNASLEAIARAIDGNRKLIHEENAKDIARAGEDGVSPALLHRLEFSDEKIDSVIKGLHELVSLPDPVGRVKEKRELDPGFVLEKVTFPIGVIAMIFEARPDALVQIAGLSMKSGNAVVLKGGKEATLTNRVLVSIIREASLPIVGTEWILGIESHEDVNAILSLDKYIDLIIPRGSNSFVRFVMEHTRIPVLGHADGICSVYVDSHADLDKALRICVDSKVQYPAACNAAETFLVNSAVADSFLPRLSAAFAEYGVKVHADARSIGYFPSAVPASEDDFCREFLSLECAVKIVDSIDEAIEHIQEHGSHHTDSIVTESEESRKTFFTSVDSADVFCNCSTRFADGFRFGLGAEVGISTSKIHARGPVGLDGLMTTKWLLSGNGETVAEYSGRNGKSFHHKELM